jgi:hypothetical protein
MRKPKMNIFNFNKLNTSEEPEIKRILKIVKIAKNLNAGISEFAVELKKCAQDTGISEMEIYELYISLLKEAIINDPYAP